MASPFLILLPAVMAIIRAEAFRAWRSLRRFGFESSDLRQEFRIRLLEAEGAYDAARSSPATFAGHSCRQRTLQLLEPNLTAKRNGGSVPLSLSSPVGDQEQEEEALQLIDTVSEDWCTIRIGLRSRPTAELMELAADVAHVIEGLPADLAAVARLLLEGEPDVAVAKRLRISRSTLYRRIGQLRRIFRQAGLHSYNIREAA
jgi:hypothetical protein